MSWVGSDGLTSAQRWQLQQKLAIDLASLPPGWSYGIKRSVVHNDEKTIYSLEDEDGNVVYNISEHRCWLPGDFLSLTDAMAAFEDDEKAKGGQS